VIFVTLGTQAFQFDRILRALAERAGGEELVVQGGASTFRPPGATWFEYIEHDELVAYVRQARVVVAHAGVGSIMTAVAEGKRPVVVPRLGAHGEAVDDHQVDFARRLARAGLVTLVEDLDELDPALAAGTIPPDAPAAAAGRSLAVDVRDYLAEVCYSRYPRLRNLSSTSTGEAPS
jgi:UDP-N-acetylglucosamine transferase subunit ALG13